MSETAISPLEADRAFQQSLGLRPYGQESGKWLNLGTVTVDKETPWARVTVEVCQMPAEFWRFTVEPLIEDVQAVTIETGSGRLSDYWPIVEKFCNGLLYVTPREEKLSSED